MFLDVNNDGVINRLDKRFTKGVQQTSYGGLLNVWKLHGFELAVLIQFSNRRALRYMPGLPGTRVNQPDYVMNRWTGEGNDAGQARFGLQHAMLLDYAHLTQSDYALVDASVPYSSKHSR